MIRRKINIKEFFEVPQICPVCSHKTEEEGKFLICPNDNCPALEYGNLFKWISVLDIKGIGDATIEILPEKRLVTEPSHFYTLTETDFEYLDGLGQKTATKILRNLNAKKKLDLDVFVAALNIKDVSRSTAAMMMGAGFDTIDKMHGATIAELIKIPGIEMVTAEKITVGLTDKYTIIENLFEVGIKIKEPVVIIDGKFSGLLFCTTGPLETMDRKEFEEKVKMNGGLNKGVSKKLNYLVTNDPDSGTGKNKKAEDLIEEGYEIKVIDEQTFLEMLK